MAQAADRDRCSDGTKVVRSTVPAPEDDAMTVAIQRTRCCCWSTASTRFNPACRTLTRPRLHRHDIGRLPIDGAKPEKPRFKTNSIGYIHNDMAEVRTGQGKLHVSVVLDHKSKQAVIAAIPCRMHTLLTDNGIQFADLRATATAGPTESTDSTISAANRSPAHQAKPPADQRPG